MFTIYISHIKFSCNICTNVYIYIYALNKEIYIYISYIYITQIMKPVKGANKQPYSHPLISPIFTLEIVE